MSNTRHHAIIVTHWDKSLVSRAHDLARMSGLGAQCTDLVRSPINAFYTFVITPDGSYECWAESDEADAQRAQFVERVRQISPHLNVVAFSYGGDGDSGPARIEHDSKSQEPKTAPAPTPQA